MKKSLLLLLLVAATAFTAQAKSYELYVGGVHVTDANKNAIQEGVSFSIDDENVGHLYLDNANIVSSNIDGSAIDFKGTSAMRELDIHITGSCSFTAQRGYGLFMYTDVNELAYVFIKPETDDARLTVKVSKNGFFMQGDSELNFGELGLKKKLIIDVTAGNEGLKASNGEAYLTISPYTNLYMKAGNDDTPQTIFVGLYDLSILGTPTITPECEWNSDAQELYLADSTNPVTGELTIINFATTGIEEVLASQSYSFAQAQKNIVDGILYIIRDGKAYNAQGAEVR